LRVWFQPYLQISHKICERSWAARLANSFWPPTPAHPLSEQRNGNGEEQQYAAPLEAEISALKQVNQMLRDQLDDTRGQRDKWEQAARMALRQLPAPKAPTRFWRWPMRRAA
jgi:hypothetical protein